jgi:branched-chain amino acid transport system substrate-binding protein
VVSLRNKSRFGRGLSTFVSSVLVAVLSACGGGSTTSGGTSEPIIIGAKGPLSGAASVAGANFRFGVDLAAKQINAAGGINGRTLKVVYEDDQGSSAGGVTAARALIDQDNAFLIIDGGTSTSVPPVLPYYHGLQQPIYVSYAGDPRVLETFDPKLYLGSGLPVAAWIPDYMARLRQLGAKKVAIATCEQASCTVAGPALQKAIGASNDIKLVAYQTYQLADTSYAAQTQAIANAKPDAVVIFSLALGANIISAFRRAGISAPLLIDPNLASTETIKTQGKNVEGAYVYWYAASQFFADPQPPMSTWISNLKAMAGTLPPGSPGIHASLAYSDMFVIAEGLKRAGRNVTSKTFTAALDSMTNYVGGRDGWKGVADPIGLPRTFTPSDHQGTRGGTWLVVQNGEFIPAKP